MYKKVIFETAEEFFKACDPGSQMKPTVPTSVSVVFDGSSLPRFTGEDAHKFGFSGKVTQSDMITVAFRIAGSKVHIT